MGECSPTRWPATAKQKAPQNRFANTSNKPVLQKKGFEKQKGNKIIPSHPYAINPCVFMHLSKNGWRRKILLAFLLSIRVFVFFFLFSIRFFLFSSRAPTMIAFELLTSLKQESADMARPMPLLEPSVRRSHLFAQDPKRIPLSLLYAQIFLCPLFIAFTIPVVPLQTQNRITHSATARSSYRA